MTDDRCSWAVRRLIIIGAIIIVLVILMCYFSTEHIALSFFKRCEHRIMKIQQIKSTVHDAK